MSLCSPYPEPAKAGAPVDEALVDEAAADGAADGDAVVDSKLNFSKATSFFS